MDSQKLRSCAAAVLPISSRMGHALILGALSMAVPAAALSQSVTATLTIGTTPYVAAVNPVSNKIYVSNGQDGTVTVIDGATNNALTVRVGTNPNSIAVNPITNKIYLANARSNQVTAIDGLDNSTITIPAGFSPNSVAVNTLTNKVYVANRGNSPTFAGTVTVIDGADPGSTASVTAGTSPQSVAVNPVTNQIYV